MEPSHFWDAVFLIKILVLLASYANAVPYRTTLATIIPSTHVTQVVESTIPPPLFLPPHQNIQDTSDEIKYEWNWCAPYCDAALKPKPKQDDAKTINTRQDNVCDPLMCCVPWFLHLIPETKNGGRTHLTMMLMIISREYRGNQTRSSSEETKRLIHWLSERLTMSINGAHLIAIRR